MAFCCEALAREVTEHKAFAGGGFLYSGIVDQPTGQIEQDEDGDLERQRMLWRRLFCNYRDAFLSVLRNAAPDETLNGDDD